MHCTSFMNKTSSDGLTELLESNINLSFPWQSCMYAAAEVYSHTTRTHRAHTYTKVNISPDNPE